MSLSFRRREHPERSNRHILVLSILLALTSALLITRSSWEPRLGSGVLIEVVGEVERPGMYRLKAPTLASAVEAAGGASGLAETLLEPGCRVVVFDDGARVEGPGDYLLVGLPINVNEADEMALQAIPGVGMSTSAAIVADRRHRGPFYGVQDLMRVKGIGPSTVEILEPFVTVGNPGPRPPPTLLDLNLASAAELEALPAIGPVTAARIVVDREDKGPYEQIDDLQRVWGIGPQTIERVRSLVVVKPLPDQGLGSLSSGTSTTLVDK
ncbi:MAG: ComEA family DNA-binding protein [Proteobacteria bacterium]|nr:ComEA family DNA-binding protein [Pseudomonadota bacterium]